MRNSKTAKRALIFSMNSEMDVPSFFYVCKLCNGTFESVGTLMTHKKLKHAEESKKIKYIIFEETLIETESDGSPFSPYVSLSQLNTSDEVVTLDSRPRASTTGNNKRAPSDEIDHEKENYSSLDSTSISEKEVIKAPDELIKTIAALYNKKKSTLPPPRDNSTKTADNNKLNSSANRIESILFHDKQGTKPEDKLTEAEIIRLVNFEEIVQLPNPYVRLEELTAAQLKAKSSSSSNAKSVSGSKKRKLASGESTTKEAYRKKDARLPSKHFQRIHRIGSDSSDDGESDSSIHASDVEKKKKISFKKKSKARSPTKLSYKDTDVDTDDKDDAEVNKPMRSRSISMSQKPKMSTTGKRSSSLISISDSEADVYVSDNASTNDGSDSVKSISMADSSDAASDWSQEPDGKQFKLSQNRATKRSRRTRPKLGRKIRGTK